MRKRRGIYDNCGHGSRLAIEGAGRDARAAMETKQFGAQAPANEVLRHWVEQVRTLVTPDQVFWGDGSEEEKHFLTEQAVEQGVLIRLNQDKLPGCYYHRSNPNDVARVEQSTYICTPSRKGAGPTNNWMLPREMYDKLYTLLR